MLVNDLDFGAEARRDIEGDAIHGNRVIRRIDQFQGVVGLRAGEYSYIDGGDGLARGREQEFNLRCGGDESGDSVWIIRKTTP